MERLATKREVLEAFDRGVSASRGPIRFVLDDGQGRVCALGATRRGVLGWNGARLEDKAEHRERVARWQRVMETLEHRSTAPAWAVEIASAFPEGSPGFYQRCRLATSLAAVFDATGSFTEARAFLDKELSRLVSEGAIREGEGE